MKELEQKLDSREVAEMMEVQHKDLLKKIDSINEDFGSEKVRHEKYWQESTFENRGKQYRNFLITKRGCEFLAHKTTGTKGNLFTDRYMDRFEEMKDCIEKRQTLNTSELSPELQMFNQMFKALANQELANKEMKADIEDNKKQLQGIRDIVALTPNAWRKDTSSLISKIATKLGGFDHIKDVREESYKILNETYKVDIKRRLINKRKNMALEGCSKSKISKLTYLDVIAEDEKLINGYINIIGKMAIK